MSTDVAPPALRTCGLTVRYGGVRAVDGVSIDVAPGALVGLIGPNGAGKTTFIDAVSGFVAATGAVELTGRRIDRDPPHRRARCGLVRTFQSVELFDDLDVRGNLLVAAARPAWHTPLRDLVRPRSRSGLDAAVERWVELLALEHLLHRVPSDLSEGERKLVGVCRALSASPAVLLLDEPAAGLDTDESAVLADRLRAVAASGVSVLLVDHDMDLVLGICTTVHVLERGQVIASGPPAMVREDGRVVEAYLGHSHGRTPEAVA